MFQIKIQPYENELKYLLQHAVENELKVINYGVIKTKDELKKFEQKYHLESIIFYNQYQEGLMGDGFDYIKWAGEYETLNRLNQNYKILQDINIVN